jgi:hypothetical protein
VLVEPPRRGGKEGSAAGSPKRGKRSRRGQGSAAGSAAGDAIMEDGEGAEEDEPGSPDAKPAEAPKKKRGGFFGLGRK